MCYRSGSGRLSAWRSPLGTSFLSPHGSIWVVQGLEVTWTPGLLLPEPAFCVLRFQCVLWWTFSWTLVLCVTHGKRDLSYHTCDFSLACPHPVSHGYRLELESQWEQGSQSRGWPCWWAWLPMLPLPSVQYLELPCCSEHVPYTLYNLPFSKKASWLVVAETSVLWVNRTESWSLVGPVSIFVFIFKD